MGRPKGSVNNVSVCLTDKTWTLLTDTAQLLATPQVTAEELISIGFWKVARYTDRPENMVGRLRREMKFYIRSVHYSLILDGVDIAHHNEQRLLYRTEHEFEQWSRHHKYKIKR